MGNTIKVISNKDKFVIKDTLVPTEYGFKLRLTVL